MDIYSIFGKQSIYFRVVLDLQKSCDDCTVSPLVNTVSPLVNILHEYGTNDVMKTNEAKLIQY